MSKLHLYGFLFFLVAYSLFKYQAVPAQMGQPSYIVSTAILVALTAIIPYLISMFMIGGSNKAVRLILAGILPIVLSSIGLAIFFYIFIRPNFPGLQVQNILPRSLLPGLAMGTLLVIRELQSSQQTSQNKG